MRIEIETNGKIKDGDIRALYLLKEGVKISTPRMLRANLEFIISGLGMELVGDPSPNLNQYQS